MAILVNGNNREIGTETFTAENENITENVKCDVKDEHIGEKTKLVLETPGGDTEILLNGDYETNVLVIDLLTEALESRYSSESSPIMLYSKSSNLLPEDELVGV